MIACHHGVGQWKRRGTAGVRLGDANVGKGNAYGAIRGDLAPVPFTGISAATLATSFDATVFQGQILRERVDSFGSNGWAFIPTTRTCSTS